MPQETGSKLTPLRLAVIGCGKMGLRHMQAARDVLGVTLSAVYDSNAERAAEAGESFGASVAASLEAVCNMSDAAVIATPTRAHSAVTKTCLKAGLHCLVEKPLALSETECREIVDTAAVKNLILQVGHVERFNPAVEALLEQNLAPENIHSITARRLNPSTSRVIEDDVVLDLMIHDLDLIAALKCAPVVGISARNLGAEHSEAAMTFADGTVATVTANRNAAERTRLHRNKHPRLRAVSGAHPEDGNAPDAAVHARRNWRARNFALKSPPLLAHRPGRGNPARRARGQPNGGRGSSSARARQSTGRWKGPE